MAKRNERTLKMMESYVDLHNEGHTPKEIAKLYGISVQTVYENLGEIAEKAGVSRDSLLERVVIADHSGANFTPVEPVDRSAFYAKCDKLRQAIAEFRDELAEIIARYEEDDEL